MALSAAEALMRLYPPDLEQGAASAAAEATGWWARRGVTVTQQRDPQSQAGFASHLGL